MLMDTAEMQADEDAELPAARPSQAGATKPSWSVPHHATVTARCRRLPRKPAQGADRLEYRVGDLACRWRVVTQSLPCPVQNCRPP
jgi:hypothetical protein